MLKTRNNRSEPSSAERSYTSSEVSHVAGVSLRQLQWWDERKVVSPLHRGHKRVYTAAEAIEIIVIAELRRKGFSLQKIRGVLRFLHRKMGKRARDVLTGASEVHLLIAGKAIYLENRETRIIDLLKNARQPTCLVCVSDQLRRLNRSFRKPARAEAPLAARKARTG